MSELTKKQLGKFDQLWQETCDSWPPSGFTHRLHAGTKKDWNVISIPECSQWQSLKPIIEVVHEQWPWNIPYTESQLHITLAGLGDSIDWSKKEIELKSILYEITNELEPIHLDLQGLNILRNTIIVQTIDTNGHLKKLVNQLAKSIRNKKLVRNFRVGIHAELWWASIIRLYKPIPDDLRVFISNFRETNFGSIFIESIELCKNNKTFESTEVLLKVSLNQH